MRPGIHGLRPFAVVRGANDVASAAALKLVEAGYTVLLAEGPQPAVTRRGQSFADAAFDGVATLEGVTFRRVDDVAAWLRNGAHGLAYCSQALDALLAALQPEVLVDARMRKRAIPEGQRGLAPLVIGLGPNFTAQDNCDLAVETGWGDDLGRVVEAGPCRTLAGEPKPIGGWSRERYVYALAAGMFRTNLNIGDAVREGQVVANIVTCGSDTPIAAPKTGLLRGLIHDGVTVAEKTKCVEVVPAGTKVTGLTERPARIAAGVMEAILRRADPPPLARAAITGVLRNALSGELPLFAATLGFDRRELRALVATCLPGVTPELEWEAGAHALCASQAPSLFEPLAQLLFEHRALGLVERPARWLAHAVAAAGFGSRHLWQDLGLSGRAETTSLIELCFPALAARNTADLKWKRFLFQALGERLGTPGLRPPPAAPCTMPMRTVSVPSFPCPAPHPGAGVFPRHNPHRRTTMHTSARNEFSGTITTVTKGAVNAEVILDIGGGQQLTAIITNSSADGLGLAAGKPAVALIKAPWVILTTNDSLKTSARNRLCGTVAAARQGAVNGEVTLDIGGGKSVSAIVTNESIQSLGLKPGVGACALIKASHIILAVSA